MKVQGKRKAITNRVMKLKEYKKHYQGLKFTRFHFSCGLRLKVDKDASIKAIYNGVTRMDSVPVNIYNAIKGDL